MRNQRFILLFADFYDVGIVKTLPTEEGEEYVSQTSEIILKQSTGTGESLRALVGGKAATFG